MAVFVKGKGGGGGGLEGGKEGWDKEFHDSECGKVSLVRGVQSLFSCVCFEIL